jgi:lipid-binding SYLF domain-containing protein
MNVVERASRTRRLTRSDLKGSLEMASITRRGLIVSGAALATGAFVPTAEAATGSVAIRILSAGFIFGASGGSGVLSFEGRQYPLRIGGISAGATIGASGADLVGTAYHLHSPADIEGIYSAIGAGLAIAGGRTAARLSNARGVVLRLRGRQVGFMFSLDLSGMSISLA